MTDHDPAPRSLFPDPSAATPPVRKPAIDPDLCAFLHAAASPVAFDFIVTQVACEAGRVIRGASRPTLLSVLRAFDAGHGCSVRTKRRLIESCLRAMDRAAGVRP